jgi:putative spermidine/putrescine transport system permease protein
VNKTQRHANGYLAFVLPALVFVGVLYLLPLGWLAYASVGGPGALTGKWYAYILTSEGIHKILWTTLRIVSVTSIIALVLGYVLAYAMLRLSPRVRALLALCVLVPFWLSVLVRAFAWLILLRNNGLVNEALLGAGVIGAPLELVRNELGVIIGMVHYLIPYAVFPLYAAMRGIDDTLVMAARGAGASPLRAFADVFLPLTEPSIFGVWLLVFVFGLGFFVTPAILGGGRIVMLSEYATLTVLQSARWGLAGALSMLLLIATLALIWLVSRAVDVRRLLGAGV